MIIMRKKIRFYRQHTMETCGPSCVLMILDLYRRLEHPTIHMELNLYKHYRSYAFKGTPAVSVADCLSKYNLRTELLHSSTEYMDNRDEYYTESLYQSLLEEYRERVSRCASSVDIRAGVPISCELLREKLDAGKQLIVQTIIPGDADGIHTEVLHWVVVYGYQGDTFLACDPLSSKLTFTCEELEKYMDTPIGRIVVTVGET